MKTTKKHKTLLSSLKELRGKSIMGIALVAITGLSGYYYFLQPTEPNTSGLYKVASVIDGDTVKLADKTKVRLLAINAPEKGECGYEEARDFLTKMLKGKTVRLEKDISGMDKYDRLLRYVVLPSEDLKTDDILVNDILIKKGYARHQASPPNNRYRDLFSSSQETAKRARLGIWENCLDPDEAKALRETDQPAPNENCLIKGNISEKGYGKTYLIEGCDNYKSVKIDFKKGERYFCSEEEAQEAGWRKASNCP